jgi:hypothetical protein
MLLQVNFIGKWWLKNNHHYVWTTCKKLVNTRSGKLVKKTTNGQGIKPGYYIDRRFVKCEDLETELELIPIRLLSLS